MNKIFKCIDADCGMSFKTLQLKNQHQEIFHKNLYSEIVRDIIKKIKATNSHKSLEKRINCPSGSYNYNELAVMDIENPIYKYFENMMISVLKNWELEHPGQPLKEFVRVKVFKLQ